jgi:hypothetical protein
MALYVQSDGKMICEWLLWAKENRKDPQSVEQASNLRFETDNSRRKSRKCRHSTNLKKIIIV